jgi:hypothetical protein
MENEFWIFQDTTNSHLGLHLDNIAGGALDVKDGGGTLVPVRVGAPVGADDAARLSDVTGDPSALSWISVAFTFGDIGNTTITSSGTAQVPNGATIMAVRVNVSTAFTGGAGPAEATVTAALVGEPDFLSLGDANTEQADLFIKEVISVNGTAGPLSVAITIDAGSTSTATAGVGDVYVGYASPRS